MLNTDFTKNVKMTKATQNTFNIRNLQMYRTNHVVKVQIQEGRI